MPKLTLIFRGGEWFVCRPVSGTRGRSPRAITLYSVFRGGFSTLNEAADAAVAHDIRFNSERRGQTAAEC